MQAERQGEPFLLYRDTAGHEKILALGAGTAAAEAGLGDELKLLQAVDGEQIEPSVAGYCEAIGDAGSGEQVTLTVQDVSRGSSGDYTLAGAPPEDIEVALE